MPSLGWTERGDICIDANEGGNEHREPGLGHENDEAHRADEQAFAVATARYDAAAVTAAASQC